MPMLLCSEGDCCAIFDVKISAKSTYSPSLIPFDSLSVRLFPCAAIVGVGSPVISNSLLVPGRDNAGGKEGLLQGFSSFTFTSFTCSFNSLCSTSIRWNCCDKFFIASSMARSVDFGLSAFEGCHPSQFFPGVPKEWLALSSLQPGHFPFRVAMIYIIMI